MTEAGNRPDDTQALAACKALVASILSTDARGNVYALGELQAAADLARKAIDCAGEVRESQAALDVLAERRRQVEVEDFDASHDDMATGGQLAGAAACYAINGVKHWAAKQAASRLWPWDRKWWKPTNPRRDLVKAGALILAEIERLDGTSPSAAAQEADRNG